MPKPPMRNRTVRLSEQQDADLRAAAERLNLRDSDIIRVALDEWLDEFARMSKRAGRRKVA